MNGAYHSSSKMKKGHEKPRDRRAMVLKRRGKDKSERKLNLFLHRPPHWTYTTPDTICSLWPGELHLHSQFASDIGIYKYNLLLAPSSSSVLCPCWSFIIVLFSLSFHSWYCSKRLSVAWLLSTNIISVRSVVVGHDEVREEVTMDQRITWIISKFPASSICFLFSSLIPFPCIVLILWKDVQVWNVRDQLIIRLRSDAVACRSAGQKVSRYIFSYLLFPFCFLFSILLLLLLIYIKSDWCIDV